MSNSIDEISFKVGELTGQVASLSSNVARLNEQFNLMTVNIGKLNNFKIKVTTIAAVCSACITFALQYLSGK